MDALPGLQLLHKYFFSHDWAFDTERGVDGFKLPSLSDKECRFSLSTPYALRLKQGSKGLLSSYRPAVRLDGSFGWVPSLIAPSSYLAGLWEFVEWLCLRLSLHFQLSAFHSNFWQPGCCSAVRQWIALVLSCAEPSSLCLWEPHPTFLSLNGPFSHSLWSWMGMSVRCPWFTPPLVVCHCLGH